MGRATSGAQPRYRPKEHQQQAIERPHAQNSLVPALIYFVAHRIQTLNHYQ